ncbi:MAG TPA: glycosyltransferase family A protein [Gammaproteobacteria bacterium]|nr:glycosyltransferase family A protein [Gammaproteobacteria bacterium]
MDGSTVAVVIPTYNRSGLVVQSIEAILNQTRPPDEVVVVDDGSPDETPAVVAAFGDRVRYVRQENAGRPSALNRGITEVHSQYVLIMDDDDIALPDALERHLGFLHAHPQVDFSYSGHYLFKSHSPPSRLAPEDMKDCRSFDEAELFIEAMIWLPFFMQGMLVPLSCYWQVGPFDTTLSSNDDYDMILRLARRFRGGKVPRPTFLLREHSGARGPAHERRAAADREATFRAYDEKILSKFHRRLSLMEYLPRGAVNEPLNAIQIRQAILQRAWIMARHGIYGRAFKDLRAVLDASGGGLRLTGREQSMLSQMFNVELWWLDMCPEYPIRIGEFLRRRRAWSALGHCAVGLSWRVARALHSGRYAEASKLAAHLARLTGVRGGASFARTAVGRRFRRRAAVA